MSDKAKEGAKSGNNTSNGPSASHKSGPLSKETPGSARLSRKQSKGLVSQTGAPIFEVDDSTNSVRISKGARICGTTDPNLIQTLLGQIRDVTPRNGQYDLQNLKWSVAAIQGIVPRNPLEGLLAVQMVGVHALAMECLKHASITGQTPEAIDANVHRAVRLLRTFTSQMEALNRNRGKINQQTVVGNVNVNDGGQAIVGSVEHRGGRKKGSEEIDTDKDT